MTWRAEDLLEGFQRLEHLRALWKDPTALSEADFNPMFRAAQKAIEEGDRSATTRMYLRLIKNKAARLRKDGIGPPVPLPAPDDLGIRWVDTRGHVLRIFVAETYSRLKLVSEKLNFDPDDARWDAVAILTGRGIYQPGFQINRAQFLLRQLMGQVAYEELVAPLRVQKHKHVPDVGSTGDGNRIGPYDPEWTPNPEDVAANPVAPPPGDEKLPGIL